MSDVEREVKSISPILQAVLLKQIEKVADALDNDDQKRAWRCTDTLYGQSPPKVKAECQKEFEDAKKAVLAAAQENGVDIYDTMRIRSKQILRRMEIKTRPLYCKIIEALYNGGYMEKYDTTPIGREIELETYR